MNLQYVGLIAACLLLAVYIPMALLPGRTRGAFVAFCRSWPAGIVLAAVDLIWSGVYLYRMPLSWLDPVRAWMPVIMVVSFVAVIFCLRELLAARALGGLLLLLPSIMFLHARFHVSPFRFVVTVLAYVLVVKGIFLMCYPYLLRRWVARLGEGRRFRTIGCIGVAFAAFLLVVSLTQYGNGAAADPSSAAAPKSAGTQQ